MKIDSDTKRKQAERIRRKVTTELSVLGFKRHRTTSWIRENEHLIQGIHSHLFSFDTSFRIHLFLHVKDLEPVDWGLNGLSTFGGWYSHKPSVWKKARKYVFHFNRLPESVDSCAAEVIAYCVDVAEPWFRNHEDLEKLVNDVESPLSIEGRRVLAERLVD